ALYGVEISQPNNTVGGTTTPLRNVVSGNVRSGVVLYLSTATGNKVIGNYIGGSTAGSGNVISGNGAGGVGVYNASARNTISGNFIGTDAPGSLPLPNTKFAV